MNTEQVWHEVCHRRYLQKRTPPPSETPTQISLSDMMNRDYMCAIRWMCCSTAVRKFELRVESPPLTAREEEGCELAWE